MDDWTLLLVLLAIAGGYFCAGVSWGRRRGESDCMYGGCRNLATVFITTDVRYQSCRSHLVRMLLDLKAYGYQWQ